MNEYRWPEAENRAWVGKRTCPKQFRRMGLALAGACLLGGLQESAFGQDRAKDSATKPVIKIVSTGGTIANTRDGRIPIQQVIADIRKNFPETVGLLDSVTLEATEVVRVGSHELSSRDFLEIARTVNRLAQDPRATGVIVTHGTTTSEDTAFFLHLLVKTKKPVVVTNSQRQHRSVGNDGDKNFVDAVSVVLSPEAAGKGVLLVSNQTINSGREVLKTSGRPGSYLSGIHGMLGIIDTDKVTFYRAPTRRHTFDSEFDVERITTLPKVEVISAYYDADPALIQAAAEMGVKGIVLNGFTSSGGPSTTQEEILGTLWKKGMPIVHTARGGVNTRIVLGGEHKFISGDNLPPHKARILLQLALTKTSDLKEIQRIFNEY